MTPTWSPSLSQSLALLTTLVVGCAAAHEPRAPVAHSRAAPATAARAPVASATPLDPKRCDRREPNEPFAIRIRFPGRSTDIQSAIGAYHLPEVAARLCNDRRLGLSLITAGLGDEVPIVTAQLEALREALLKLGVCEEQVANVEVLATGHSYGVSIHTVGRSTTACTLRTEGEPPTFAMPSPKSQMTLDGRVVAGPAMPRGDDFSCREQLGDGTLPFRDTLRMSPTIHFKDGALTESAKAIMADVAYDLCMNPLMVARVIVHFPPKQKSNIEPGVGAITDHMKSIGIAPSRVVFAHFPSAKSTDVWFRMRAVVPAAPPRVADPGEAGESKAGE